MKKPELLSPAGDIERLKVAFAYGADSVYLGGKAFGMRSKADNFTIDEIEEGIKHAHLLGKKVYITANICAHNEDLVEMEKYFRELERLNADALIISDLGVFDLAKRAAPKTDIHISTQANVTNHASAAFWERLGAQRIILARELCLEEIKEIKMKVPNIELETFVHGSMCMAYSGRCLISNFMNDRDANRGHCSQPCRWSYMVVEEKSGDAIPVYEDEHGAYIFSSKDLNMIAHIPGLVNAGIDSYKIEGRMKSSYYVGIVTKIYREAIDDYFDDPELYTSKIPYYQSELSKMSHREYTTGFFYGKVTGEDHAYYDCEQVRIQDYLAIIDSYDESTGFCVAEQRNKFEVGEKIDIIRASGETFTQEVETMLGENGVRIKSASHPKQKIQLKVDVPVQKFDMLRRSVARKA
ncbi:MAG: U32 family peptidase [Oscillospiraceae bacterium]|nr:U32 family peptidase [Oscillospiraceae bacterium]